MSRTALVTGGSGGLGSAVTERLLQEGWRVVVPWIVEAELARVPSHPRLELVLQLRGTAGEHQVPGDPKVGYAQLYGAPGTAGVSILTT